MKYTNHIYGIVYLLEKLYWLKEEC